MELALCGGCARHVDHAAPSCPFCGAAVSAAPVRRRFQRLTRAAVLLGASTLAACGADEAPLQDPIAQPYGAPPDPTPPPEPDDGPEMPEESVDPTPEPLPDPDPGMMVPAYGAPMPAE